MFFLQARGPPYFAVFYYHNGKQLLSLQREYSWVEKQEDDKNIEEKKYNLQSRSKFMHDNFTPES